MSTQKKYLPLSSKLAIFAGIVTAAVLVVTLFRSTSSEFALGVIVGVAGVLFGGLSVFLQRVPRSQGERDLVQDRLSWIAHTLYLRRDYGPDQLDIAVWVPRTRLLRRRGISDPEILYRLAPGKSGSEQTVIGARGGIISRSFRENRPLYFALPRDASAADFGITADDEWASRMAGKFAFYTVPVVSGKGKPIAVLSLVIKSSATDYDKGIFEVLQNAAKRLSPALQ